MYDRHVPDLPSIFPALNPLQQHQAAKSPLISNYSFIMHQPIATVWLDLVTWKLTDCFRKSTRPPVDNRAAHAPRLQTMIETVEDSHTDWLAIYYM